MHQSAVSFDMFWLLNTESFGFGKVKKMALPTCKETGLLYKQYIINGKKTELVQNRSNFVQKAMEYMLTLDTSCINKIRDAVIIISPYLTCTEIVDGINAVYEIVDKLLTDISSRCNSIEFKRLNSFSGLSDSPWESDISKFQILQQIAQEQRDKKLLVMFSIQTTKDITQQEMKKMEMDNDKMDCKEIVKAYSESKMYHSILNIFIRVNGKICIHTIHDVNGIWRPSYGFVKFNMNASRLTQREINKLRGINLKIGNWEDRNIIFNSMVSMDTNNKQGFKMGGCCGFSIFLIVLYAKIMSHGNINLIMRALNACNANTNKRWNPGNWSRKDALAIKMSLHVFIDKTQDLLHDILKDYPDVEWDFSKEQFVDEYVKGLKIFEHTVHREARKRKQSRKNAGKSKPKKQASFGRDVLYKLQRFRVQHSKFSWRNKRKFKV